MFWVQQSRRTQLQSPLNRGCKRASIAGQGWRGTRNGGAHSRPFTLDFQKWLEGDPIGRMELGALGTKFSAGGVRTAELWEDPGRSEVSVSVVCGGHTTATAFSAECRRVSLTGISQGLEAPSRGCKACGMQEAAWGSMRHRLEAVFPSKGPPCVAYRLES